MKNDMKDFIEESMVAVSARSAAEVVFMCDDLNADYVLKKYDSNEIIYESRKQYSAEKFFIIVIVNCYSVSVVFSIVLTRSEARIVYSKVIQRKEEFMEAFKKAVEHAFERKLSEEERKKVEKLAEIVMKKYDYALPIEF